MENVIVLPILVQYISYSIYISAKMVKAKYTEKSRGVIE